MMGVRGIYRSGAMGAAGCGRGMEPRGDESTKGGACHCLRQCQCQLNREREEGKRERGEGEKEERRRREGGEREERERGEGEKEERRRRERGERGEGEKEERRRRERGEERERGEREERERVKEERDRRKKGVREEEQGRDQDGGGEGRKEKRRVGKRLSPAGGHCAPHVRAPYPSVLTPGASSRHFHCARSVCLCRQCASLTPFSTQSSPTPCRNTSGDTCPQNPQSHSLLRFPPQRPSSLPFYSPSLSILFFSLPYPLLECGLR